MFYGLELEAEVGRMRFAEDATARAVRPDGRGLLMGMERSPLGQRLLSFRLGL